MIFYSLRGDGGGARATTQNFSNFLRVQIEQSRLFNSIKSAYFTLISLYAIASHHIILFIAHFLQILMSATQDKLPYHIADKLEDLGCVSSRTLLNVLHSRQVGSCTAHRLNVITCLFAYILCTLFPCSYSASDIQDIDRWIHEGFEGRDRGLVRFAAVLVHYIEEKVASAITTAISNPSFIGIDSFLTELFNVLEIRKCPYINLTAGNRKQKRTAVFEDLFLRTYVMDFLISEVQARRIVSQQAYGETADLNRLGDLTLNDGLHDTVALVRASKKLPPAVRQLPVGTYVGVQLSLMAEELLKAYALTPEAAVARAGDIEKVVAQTLAGKYPRSLANALLFDKQKVCKRVVWAAAAVW